MIKSIDIYRIYHLLYFITVFYTFLDCCMYNRVLLIGQNKRIIIIIIIIITEEGR